MRIKKITGGTLKSNGYILYTRQGGPCYIIDPGYQPKKFIDFVRGENLSLQGILLTHLHRDHVGGAEALGQELDAPIYMHGEDAEQYKGRVDVWLRDGDTFDLDGETLQILHTPGHTGGSICILAEKSKVCFTGDTIFDTDLGRTDLAGGSEERLAASVRKVCDRWGNDLVIYPGHDGSCTMKQVRSGNPEFNALRQGHER